MNQISNVLTDLQNRHNCRLISIYSYAIITGSDGYFEAVGMPSNASDVTFLPIPESRVLHEC